MRELRTSEIVVPDRIQAQFAGFTTKARKTIREARGERFDEIRSRFFGVSNEGKFGAINTEIRDAQRDLIVLGKMNPVSSTFLDDGCMVTCRIGSHTLSVDAKNPRRFASMSGMLNHIRTDSDYYLDGQLVKSTPGEARDWDVASDTSKDVVERFTRKPAEDHIGDIDPELQRAFDFLGQLAATGSLLPPRQQDIFEDVVQLI